VHKPPIQHRGERLDSSDFSIPGTKKRQSFVTPQLKGPSVFGELEERKSQFGR